MTYFLKNNFVSKLISLWEAHDIFVLQYKRSSTVSNSNNIRGPYNANALSRYVELVLVADKSVFEKHGHEVSKIYNRCKDIANIVNAVSFCLYSIFFFFISELVAHYCFYFWYLCLICHQCFCSQNDLL